MALSPVYYPNFAKKGRLSIITNNLLSNAYRKIKNNLPDFVFSSFVKILPLFLIISLFDIIGLVIIFPVINILIEPQSIEKNEYLLAIFDHLKFNDTVSFVLFLLCVITAFFVLKNIVIFGCSKIQTRMAFQLAGKLAYGTYSSYLSKPYRFFSENNTAILLRNFSQLPFELVTYVVFPLAIIINELFIIVIIISLMTFIDPILFLAIIAFSLPFIVTYNFIFRKKLKRISDKRNRQTAEIYKLGMQSMEGFREMTVFNKLSYFKPIFKKSIDIYSKTQSDLYFLNQFSPKIIEFVAVICISGIFVTGFLFGKDLQSLGQFLIVFSLAASRMIPSMNKIILSGNYIKSSAFTIDYFRKEDVKDKGNIAKSLQPISFKEKIEIKELSFSFGAPGDLVLKNIHLEIKKGQTIGIIGPSGSGKTTFLNILLRLYTETTGGIYVDGVKIESSNLADWYNLVSYVPQNITLLDGTIKENISFGVHPKEADQSRLRAVIEQAQLAEFVDNLPLKENSLVGENGIKISGGQRQRIGIARALYHGGEILIFDEATSALDTETEEMLTDAINQISHRNLTIVIVAHRLQTLKYCDLIYKIEKGVLNPHKFKPTEIS